MIGNSIKYRETQNITWWNNIESGSFDRVEFHNLLMSSSCNLLLWKNSNFYYIHWVTLTFRIWNCKGNVNLCNFYSFWSSCLIFISTLTDANQKEHHNLNLFGRKMEIVLHPVANTLLTETEQGCLSTESIWKVTKISHICCLYWCNIIMIYGIIHRIQITSKLSINRSSNIYMYGNKCLGNGR